MHSDRIRLTHGNEGEEIISLTVLPSEDGALIKDLLRGAMRLSSTLLKKVKHGGVSVCGTAVTMRRLVHSGDVIEVTLPREESEGIPPIFIPLRVLYEDDYILAVDKPTGMPVHPSRGNSLPTLANAVMAYMGEGFVFRAVNRLDRDTSGVVIIAKNQYAAGILSADMKGGKFEKYYEAVLSVPPRELRGIIDAPIEREGEDSMKRAVRVDGKRAVTEYRVREILPDGRAVCDIRLHTGRTHQIRVHMAHVGAPLYADFLYGERVEGECYTLRACRICLPHPTTGEMIEIKAV